MVKDPGTKLIAGQNSKGFERGPENRAEKSEQVEEIEILDGTQLVVLTEYSGLDVSSMVELRNGLRGINAGYRIMRTPRKDCDGGNGSRRAEPALQGSNR